MGKCLVCSMMDRCQKIVQNSNDRCHSPYVEVHGNTRPHN